MACAIVHCACSTPLVATFNLSNPNVSKTVTRWWMDSKRFQSSRLVDVILLLRAIAADVVEKKYGRAVFFHSHSTLIEFVYAAARACKYLFMQTLRLRYATYIPTTSHRLTHWSILLLWRCRSSSLFMCVSHNEMNEWTMPRESPIIGRIGL